MIDPFGRAITYLRVSVTDRCDLRCVYRMAEDMTFLPRRDLLTLEELDRLCAAFIRLGTTKIRITGGEPLVRRDVMRLFGSLGGRIGNGLQELTVTKPAAGCSPEFPGRVIAALAGDPDVMTRSGGTFITAEVAHDYGITDIDGRVIPSLRAERGSPIWGPITQAAHGR